MEIKTEIIKATCKGQKDNNSDNQDFTLIAENKNYLLVTVSDGLGSSENSLEGAKVVCKIIRHLIKNSDLNIQSRDLSRAIVNKWNAVISRKSGVIKDYRTTNSFIIVLKGQRKIIIGRLGDVMVSMRIDGVNVPIASFDKEFINETECLGSDGSQEFEIDFYDFQSSFEFLIATDGIGDELVEDKLDLLFNYLKTKYAAVPKSRRNYLLKREIEQSLNNKNNDDKSIVFAWSNLVN